MSGEAKTVGAEKEYAPIIVLVCALQTAGADIIASSGYLTAGLHLNLLEASQFHGELRDARKAIQKAIAALDAYEAAIAATKPAAA